MELRRWLGMTALLLMLSGCVEDDGYNAAPNVPPRPPTINPRPADCPAVGPKITTGIVEATMGYRAVVVTLANCSAQPLIINGYPVVAILDADRNTMPVPVTPGVVKVATDRGPARIRLAQGGTVQAAVTWFNSDDMISGRKVAGDFLSLAPGQGDPVVVLPIATDINLRTKVSVTAWSLRSPLSS
ncbi:DUF4232 domain-containing protein [Kribbella sp. NPDC056861]|uniref:DUF4232 domain-containing protein n=1 Tax=Kribbella sp. NPDC056861 TaxID=3154857 RepID=UPI00341B59D0